MSPARADCIVSAGFPHILENPGFFFFKIPGPGKSWKMTLFLESPGKISLKIMH